jgi:alpha-D-ribose 1-methylphosphonate 5-triphosphate synthase subunit PhnL
MKLITIGNSPITKTIYAGHLNKKGNMWLEKQDCTIDILMATVEYCLQHGDQVITNSKTGEVEFEISVKDYRQQAR